MTEKNNTYISFGTGFSGLLTIAFIILKLCNVIDWSWWWVVSPILISLSIPFVILLLILMLVYLHALLIR